MTTKIIITIAVFAALFVAWFLFTVRVNPKAKRQERSKYHRIADIAGGLILAALPWVGTPNGSLPASILLSIFGILAIYRGLSGWLFNRKPVGETASADSETGGLVGPPLR